MTILLLMFIPIILALLIKFKILGYIIYLLPYILKVFSRVKQSNPNYPRQNIDISGIEEAYEILGLTMDASDEEIDRAYKELIRKNHPDMGGSEYIAKKINAAREYIIKSKETRGR
ncbi:MAG: DnaJ domain-containing protein [Pseudomonadota bacterium]|nr:DnaJ domain-containing protein [Pseudomonadota bacterium]